MNTRGFQRDSLAAAAEAEAAEPEQDSFVPMGKFTRKPSLTLDVAVMDASRSSLGVLTRAKTLALQRLQLAAPPPDPDVSYLELRSRRLQKRMQRRNSCRGCACGGKAGVGGGEESCFRSVIGGEGLGTEAPFGGNDLHSNASDRGTQESTPDDLSRPADSTITTPSATAKKTCSSQAASKSVKNANSPSAVELEEFFNLEEQSLQRHFIDKYNFDIINDLPLPGRYEWVALRP